MSSGCTGQIRRNHHHRTPRHRDRGDHADTSNYIFPSSFVVPFCMQPGGTSLSSDPTRNTQRLLRSCFNRLFLAIHHHCPYLRRARERRPHGGQLFWRRPLSSPDFAPFEGVTANTTGLTRLSPRSHSGSRAPSRPGGSAGRRHRRIGQVTLAQ